MENCRDQNHPPPSSVPRQETGLQEEYAGIDDGPVLDQLENYMQKRVEKSFFTRWNLNDVSMIVRGCT